ncbi:MAG: hypothetical protein WHS46_09980 [Desulfosoma sp.]
MGTIDGKRGCGFSEKLWGGLMVRPYRVLVLGGSMDPSLQGNDFGWLYCCALTGSKESEDVDFGVVLADKILWCHSKSLVCR